MLKRILFIISLVLLVSASSFAQYDVSWSHYFEMEPAFNPAAVGKEDKLNIVGSYAMDFAGFENNPKVLYIGADMPFYFARTYHGAGLSLLNDQIGLFTHQNLTLKYAIRTTLFGGRLNIGAQAALISEKFDGSKLDLEDSSDLAFAKSEVTGTGFDLGFGLYYLRRPWYVGISAQHVLAPLIDLGETNELKITPTFYLTGGYNIKLRNPFLTIHPSALIRTDGKAYRADITCRLAYTSDAKHMYGGISYSPMNSITVLIGGALHGINVGYSYEVYTSNINIGNGSHALFVGYKTDINLFKKGKNKHKSVRIL